MKSLEDQILELQLEIANLKRAAGRLKKLEKQYELDKPELARLEKKVDKEYKVILDLKKKGFIDLFVDRQGDKEERLEKANEEYYNAVVQLKNTERSVNLLEFEINILREKASNLSEKGLLLQKLKYKQKHTIELSVKRETDKALVVKNRLQIIFKKLISSGRKIQVHLEEIQSSLTKMETWQNYNLSDSEKQKIFKEEFAHIEKAIHEQNLELLHYNGELQKLSEFEKYVNPNDRENLEKSAIECLKLKEKLELFAKNTLNDFPTIQNLQNELIKLKAKIVAIQYGIDQTTKLLRS